MAYLIKAPTGAPFGLPETGAFRPEIWSTDILRYRRSQLGIVQDTKKMAFTGRPGDRIRLPRLGRLGVRQMVPGNPVHFQNRTEGEWNMYVDRYMESSFSIQDIVRIQSHTDLRREYTSEAGRALAEDLENFALGMRAAIIGYSSTSHVVSNNPISYAEVLAANTILDKRKVPQEGRVLWISPSQKGSMLNENKFISRDYNGGGSPVSSGTIGEILGIPVKVSNHMLVNSTTGYTNGDGATGQPTPGMSGSPYFPTQYGDTTEVYTPTALTASYYSAILWHPECLAVAMQKMPTVDADWNTDYQEWHVVQTQLYAMKLYRPDHGVVISTDDDNLI